MKSRATFEVVRNARGDLFEVVLLPGRVRFASCDDDGGEPNFPRGHVLPMEIVGKKCRLYDPLSLLDVTRALRAGALHYRPAFIYFLRADDSIELEQMIAGIGPIAAGHA